MLLDAGGDALLGEDLGLELRDALREDASARRAVGFATLRGVRFFIEPFAPDDVLYVYGAGHVAHSVVPLAAQVGFRTIVLDDRAEFANPERFPAAREVVVLDAFEGCFAGRPPRAGASILIMTRGHGHDLEVLRQALATEAGYVGMVGSRRKRDALFEALRHEGVTAAALASVHCPVGLAIGAQTPDEIAVSIVAELIAVRARKRHGG